MKKMKMINHINNSSAISMASAVAVIGIILGLNVLSLLSVDAFPTTGTAGSASPSPSPSPSPPPSAIDSTSPSPSPGPGWTEIEVVVEVTQVPQNDPSVSEEELNIENIENLENLETLENEQMTLASITGVNTIRPEPDRIDDLTTTQTATTRDIESQSGVTVITSTETDVVPIVSESDLEVEIKIEDLDSTTTSTPTPGAESEAEQTLVESSGGDIDPAKKEILKELQNIWHYTEELGEDQNDLKSSLASLVHMTYARVYDQTDETLVRLKYLLRRLRTRLLYVDDPNPNPNTDKNTNQNQNSLPAETETENQSFHENENENENTSQSTPATTSTTTKENSENPESSGPLISNIPDKISAFRKRRSYDNDDTETIKTDIESNRGYDYKWRYNASTTTILASANPSDNSLFPLPLTHKDQDANANDPDPDRFSYTMDSHNHNHQGVKSPSTTSKTPTKRPPTNFHIFNNVLSPDDDHDEDDHDDGFVKVTITALEKLPIINNTNTNTLIRNLTKATVTATVLPLIEPVTVTLFPVKVNDTVSDVYTPAVVQTSGSFTNEPTLDNIIQSIIDILKTPIQKPTMINKPVPHTPLNIGIFDQLGVGVGAGLDIGQDQDPGNQNQTSNEQDDGEYLGGLPSYIHKLALGLLNSGDSPGVSTGTGAPTTTDFIQGLKDKYKNSTFADSDTWSLIASDLNMDKNATTTTTTDSISNSTDTDATDTDTDLMIIDSPTDPLALNGTMEKVFQIVRVFTTLPNSSRLVLFFSLGISVMSIALGLYSLGPPIVAVGVLGIILPVFFLFFFQSSLGKRKTKTSKIDQLFDNLHSEDFFKALDLLADAVEKYETKGQRKKQ